MSEMIERVARAVREEIVRQFRDADRAKWPGGVHMYEEHVGPHLIASAAIQAMRKPTEAMIGAGMRETDTDLAGEYRAMIDEALR